MTIDKHRALHREGLDHVAALEQIIDQLKGLGPHPLDGHNALHNLREHLDQLSRR